MAATRVTAPTEQRGQSNGSRLAPVAGLFFLLSGLAVLFVGTILPDLRPRPVEISFGRTSWEAVNQLSPTRDSVPTTGNPPALITPVDQGFGDHFDAVAASGLHAASSRLADCSAQPFGDTGGQATAGIAPVESSPAQRDLREDLAQMAAAQRNRWTTSGPILRLWAAAHNPSQGSSDDRIANALFVPGSPGQAPSEVTNVRARCVPLRPRVSSPQPSLTPSPQHQFPLIAPHKPPTPGFYWRGTRRTKTARPKGHGHRGDGSRR